MTEILYGRAEDASAEYKALIRRLIQQNSAARICDVGGGAYPTLPIEYVTQNQLDYTVLDLSPEELEKCPQGYAKAVADICSSELSIAGEFDLVCSRMVAEHIGDPEAFHRNILRLLTPGGVALHFFPTLYSLPFVVNRLLPEPVTAALQRFAAPRDGKFPAYYSWCRGPTPRQIERFERMGYMVVLYKGFFGHRYWDKIPFAREIHRRLSSFLVRHPIPQLTSYAHLVLRKKAVDRA
jgi:SAM-dependent methyltransferase